MCILGRCERTRAIGCACSHNLCISKNKPQEHFEGKSILKRSTVFPETGFSIFFVQTSLFLQIHLPQNDFHLQLFGIILAHHHVDFASLVCRISRKHSSFETGLISRCGFNWRQWAVVSDRGWRSGVYWRLPVTWRVRRRLGCLPVICSRWVSVLRFPPID